MEEWAGEGCREMISSHLYISAVKCILYKKPSVLQQKKEFYQYYKKLIKFET